MNCKYCGKELDEGAVFCTECGQSQETAPVEQTEVVEKKKGKIDLNTFSLIVGTLIIFIGILRLFNSSISISSTSFGADFYTYTYKGIVAIAKMLGTINATISWVLIAIGAYIDLKALKVRAEKK